MVLMMSQMKKGLLLLWSLLRGRLLQEVGDDEEEVMMTEGGSPEETQLDPVVGDDDETPDRTS